MRSVAREGKILIHFKSSDIRGDLRMVSVSTDLVSFLCCFASPSSFLSKNATVQSFLSPSVFLQQVIRTKIVFASKEWFGSSFYFHWRFIVRESNSWTIVFGLIYLDWAYRYSRCPFLLVSWTKTRDFIRYLVVLHLYFLSRTLIKCRRNRWIGNDRCFFSLFCVINTQNLSLLQIWLLIHSCACVISQMLSYLILIELLRRYETSRFDFVWLE